MNRPPGATDIAVLIFGGRRVPRALRGLAVVEPGDIDAALASARRVVVVGADADLAAVLTRLLRAELLNVEVAYVPRRQHTGDPGLSPPGGSSGGPPGATRVGAAGTADSRRDRVRDRRGGQMGTGRRRAAAARRGRRRRRRAIRRRRARRADRADDGAARVACPRDRWPVTPLADRPGRAVGRRRDIRGSRWCGCAADHAPLDDLPTHRGLAGRPVTNVGSFVG